MTRVAVFMEQVISANYSYLQKPAPRTNYTRLGAAVKANNCRVKRLYGGKIRGDNDIFHLPALLRLQKKKKKKQEVDL